MQEETMSSEVAVGAGVATPSFRDQLMARTFSALKHRNYRLYFTGNLVTQVGGWLYMIGQGWLVYELTNSPAYSGLVGFVSSIPVLLLSLFSGVVVDRFPRRSVLMLTQVGYMVLALAQAWLVFAGVVQPEHILILSFLQGVLNAFDGTARQAFVKDMVGSEDMMNAIALNSTIFNLSRIIGPATAGILIATVGVGWCFFLRGLSTLSVLVSMARMTLPAFAPPPRKESVLAEIREGLSYIRHNQTIWTLIVVVSITSIFGFSYNTLLPAYAKDVLKAGPDGFGLLGTATGIGALAGALTVASLGASKRKGMLLTVGNVLFPSMLFLLSLTADFATAWLILIGAGFGFMIQSSLANTLVQTNVPDHLRGRVMSVYMLSFFGMTPLGALQAGFIAEQTDVAFGVRFGAMVVLVCALLILWRVPRVRQMD